MHFSPERIFARVDRFKRDRVDKFIHTPIDSEISISYFEVPDEPIPVGEVLPLISQPDVFKPFKVGEPYGKVWGTTWFLIKGSIAAERVSNLENIEFLFDLGWFAHSPGLHSEAFAYNLRGLPFKALHPVNGWLRLKGLGSPAGENSVLEEDGNFTLLIEAASNPLLLEEICFAPTPYGEGIIDDPNRRYIIRRADIAEFNNELFEYSLDLEVLTATARTLDIESPRVRKVALALEKSMNAFDERDLSSLPAARELLKQELSRPAYSSASTFNAVAHAHIDSAWLWPVRETKRKVARTLSNVFTLLKMYPDWVYTMSSAQQYAWLEDIYPPLFAELKEWVKAGRIIPIGGQWVEADGVIPAGESLVRQITYGKRYFKKAFGIDIETIWLPDSFGYTGAYPGIARRAGFNYFLTQKISWGDSTKFPHHSFWWQGIDGTKILTHFPPTDTYNGQVNSAELAYGSKNYKESAISNNQIYLYGNGDGGGGPTREMISKANRFASLEGAAKVQHTNPNDFYKKLEAELKAEAEWANIFSGELYLEFHRGTLTSQRRMKEGNRRTESLLRIAEYAASHAAAKNPDYSYPKIELDQIWKTLLLNQFHDILPGTTIAWVANQSHREHIESQRQLREIINGALAAAGVTPKPQTSNHFLVSDFSEGNSNRIVISNSHCSLELNAKGHIISYKVKGGYLERELVPKGSEFGVFELMHDKPIQWDAWDIDKSAFHSKRVFDSPSGIEKISNGVKIGYKTQKSTFDLIISLDDDSLGPEFEVNVDWHEDEKLLKFALPFAISANTTKAETQYGLVERPVFNNLLADDAKFETSMHRFVLLEDNSQQIAVVNNNLYGFDSTPVNYGTQIRLTLLKASKYPDPNNDMMAHSFKFSVIAGPRVENRTLDAVLKKAATLNNAEFGPISELISEPLINIQDVEGKLVLDWLKLSDDEEGSVIARFYEPYGGNSRAKVFVSDALKGWRVSEVNLLEKGDLPEDLPRSLQGSGEQLVGADYEPLILNSGGFQITTLRFERVIPRVSQF